MCSISSISMTGEGFRIALSSGMLSSEWIDCSKPFQETSDLPARNSDKYAVQSPFAWCRHGSIPTNAACLAVEPYLFRRLS